MTTVEERLTGFKVGVLKRIEQAAKDNNSASVVAETRVLEELERLNRKLSEIKNALDNLESQPELGKSQEAVGMRLTKVRSGAEDDEELSFRAKGKARKKEFLGDLETAKITLVHEGGSKYRTKSGGLVGVAYASERQPDRWFLGLPSEDYITLVLLCETDGGEVLQFILTSDFFEKYRHQFSIVSGQLKFNVVRRGDRYLMLIPGIKAETINLYLGNYQPLMS